MATIFFVGAGNMAEAIARGILRSGLHKSSEIQASDPNADRRKLFEEMGVHCAADVGAVGKADVVVLAVKPYIMAEAIGQVKAAGMRDNALLISIAAGISSKFIEEASSGARVIRVMPNTPMLAGKGMSAIAAGKFATESDMDVAEKIFAAAGKVVRVAEPEIDAVTAVSGSGPAYVFYLAEVLAAAGKAAGLDEVQAGVLARETVVGAAALLDQSKDSAAELRRKVTTPNGTTQAAIESMQASDLQGLITKAVAAAAARSRELGK